MFRIRVRESTAAAKAYYTEKARQDYYSEGQEILGDWGGKGAAMLGLKGYMRDEEFSRLVENLHPKTGEQLTARMRSDRRPGFDLTFDVPKSVSLAYALTGNENIIKAARKTVWTIRDMMEENAATRVRAGLGTDALGNVYVVGTTKSLSFPVKNAVQSQCQLDDSERGAEVAAGPGDGRDYVFADLTCQCVQLAVGEAAQVARALQPGQDCQFRLLLGGSPGRALMVEAYFRVESPVPLDLPNSSTGPSPFCVPGSSERQSTAPALPRLGERLTASSGGPWARYSTSAASAA